MGRKELIKSHNKLHILESTYMYMYTLIVYNTLPDSRELEPACLLKEWQESTSPVYGLECAGLVQLLPHLPHLPRPGLGHGRIQLNLSHCANIPHLGIFTHKSMCRLKNTLSPQNCY